MPWSSSRNKRTLIAHDALAIGVLLFVSITLFTLTLFLFRAFQSHRAALAAQWSLRGRTALTHNRPTEAIAALRTALAYSPEDPADQLLLAQALADAGHTDQARDAFTTLWDTHPGDGFINLQLARLARQKGETQDAINFYRAAVFGSWPGDAIPRRRAARLELSDLLIAQRDLPAARAELLLAAANAADDPQLNLLFADKLSLAADPADALTLYRKAIALDPRNPVPLARAARTAYTLGDYPTANHLLEQALQRPARLLNPQDEADLTTLQGLLQPIAPPSSKAIRKRTPKRSPR